MENNIINTVENISTAVTFIAIGGAVAVTFFFIYAQFILGSKRVQHKLESLDGQLKRTNELLEGISRQLESMRGKDQGENRQ
jgi:hypothetical protein